MKELGDRVNLIPVIAKADTITPQEMGAFKQRVRWGTARADQLAGPSILTSGGRGLTADAARSGPG